jgi:hypothetical protein
MLLFAQLDLDALAMLDLFLQRKVARSERGGCRLPG